MNLFSRSQPTEPDAQSQAEDYAQTGRTFPADEVAWGIAIRNGFDEIDDPWYHRGVTQHAYLEGNDSVSICGFRPPESGPRTRRRSRLGLPTTGDHPMCGICARMVVAPRPKVSVPVQPTRPAVAIPVARPVEQPLAAAPPAPVVAVPIEPDTPRVPVAAAATFSAQAVPTPMAPAVESVLPFESGLPVEDALPFESAPPSESAPPVEDALPFESVRLEAAPPPTLQTPPPVVPLSPPPDVPPLPVMPLSPPPVEPVAPRPLPATPPPPSVAPDDASSRGPNLPLSPPPLAPAPPPPASASAETESEDAGSAPIDQEADTDQEG